MQYSFCPHCLRPLPHGLHCVYCGPVSQKEAGLLPPGTILGGRYLIGRVLAEDGLWIRYEARRLSDGAHVALCELFPSGAVRRGTGGLLQIVDRQKMDTAIRGVLALAEEDSGALYPRRDVFLFGGTVYSVFLPDEQTPSDPTRHLPPQDSIPAAGDAVAPLPPPMLPPGTAEPVMMQPQSTRPCPILLPQTTDAGLTAPGRNSIRTHRRPGRGVIAALASAALFLSALLLPQSAAALRTHGAAEETVSVSAPESPPESTLSGDPLPAPLWDDTTRCCSAAGGFLCPLERMDAVLYSDAQLCPVLMKAGQQLRPDLEGAVFFPVPAEGEMVYGVRYDEEGSGIWLLPLSDGDARLLYQTEGTLSWLAAGRDALFFLEDGRLGRLDVGGAVHYLCSLPGARSLAVLPEGPVWLDGRGLWLLSDDSQPTLLMAGATDWQVGDGVLYAADGETVFVLTPSGERLASYPLPAAHFVLCGGKLYYPTEDGIAAFDPKDDRRWAVLRGLASPPLRLQAAAQRDAILLWFCLEDGPDLEVRLLQTENSPSKPGMVTGRSPLDRD